MADRGVQNVLIVGVVAVGAFLVARALFTAQPVQAATQALTPQPPQEPGIVLRGRNYGAFIPFPDLAQMFTSLRTTEDAGTVLVQPGQRMQFIPDVGEPGFQVRSV